MAGEVLMVDHPDEAIMRLTLNRPDKRNALSDELRLALFDALRRGDADPDVAVMIIRGAGPSFCAGYDLSSVNHPVERATAQRDGWWSRHVVAGWFEMWDMTTPIVGQVHGWCLAGGSELAAACDLLYVAEDARIGYPPVRLMSPPDLAWQPWLMGMRRAMEALLTGDAMTGVEAVAAGVANRAYPADDLDEEVLGHARRVAKVPGELLALNKRVVHRAMEAAGMRAGLRATADIQALGFHQASSRRYMSALRDRPLRESLDERDAPFSDYRTAGAAARAATRDEG